MVAVEDHAWHVGLGDGMLRHIFFPASGESRDESEFFTLNWARYGHNRYVVYLTGQCTGM